MAPSILRSGFAEFEWSVETTRSSSHPTLRVAGRLVHSEFDPVVEAERTAKRAVDRMIESEARLLVLLGVGLGYLADALAARAAIRACACETFAWAPGRSLPESRAARRRNAAGTAHRSAEPGWGSTAHLPRHAAGPAC